MFDEELRLEFISENAIQDKALRDSLIGKRTVDYAKSEAWPDAILAKRDEMLLQVYETDESVTWVEQSVNESNKSVWYQRYIFPIAINSSGASKRSFVSYAIDITRTKELEESTNYSNWSLSKLISITGLILS